MQGLLAGIHAFQWTRTPQAATAVNMACICIDRCFHGGASATILQAVVILQLTDIVLLCVMYRPCSKPWSGSGDKPCPMCGAKVLVSQQRFRPGSSFLETKLSRLVQLELSGPLAWDSNDTISEFVHLKLMHLAISLVANKYQR